MESEDEFELMCGVKFGENMQIVDDETRDVWLELELAVLETKPVPEMDSTCDQDVLQRAQLLTTGEYLKVIQMKSVLDGFTLATGEDALHFATQWHQYLNKVFQEPATTGACVNDLARVFLTAIAYLNVYSQANYTGPALELEDVAQINTCYDSLAQANTCALILLQTTGDFPHTRCELPFFLVQARTLLHWLGNHRLANWSTDSPTPASSHTQTLLKRFHTTAWWCARAAVIHERLLLHDEPCPTLWTETQDCYQRLLVDTAFNDDPYLSARLHIEWGLAQHHFGKNKCGKQSFAAAKRITEFQCQVTGLMGKRTKYQQKDVAQMVVLAESKVAVVEPESEFAVAAAESTHSDFKETDQVVQQGDATYRTIQLDQANPDNILLENLYFADPQVASEQNIQLIDQCTLLAMCLDVANSNPKDGLTREQMLPYVARVLKNPNNWMVYSTGLLEKAWLECERNHSIERAVLQVQALVDQHTTRLTITQASLQAIEDAAPAHERLAYLHALVFPPRYALRRDLAERYFKLGVIHSALEIFEELEMWDEIVECYTLLEKPKRAEELVRQRLEIAPSPFMWCCLGDLTQNIECYETAWALSNQRYARAKRTLGRYYFEMEQMEESIKHLQLSCQAKPQDGRTWFFLGVASMRAERWDVSIGAFRRVVQTDPQNGEAWGNIGSIHFRRGDYPMAFNAFQEGLKIKRHMWQMWENFALCAMESSKYGDAMYAMHQLLDMRDKHKRPIDHEMLAWLVEIIVFPQDSEQEEEEEEEEEEEIVIPERTPPVSNMYYKKQLAMLLGRMGSIETTNAKLWQVYAHFNEGMDRQSKALDCRLKQCRALQKSGWESNEAAVKEVCVASAQLATAYIRAGNPYSGRMFVRGILNKAQINYPQLDECAQLVQTLSEIEALSTTGS